jgi:hypothetical protein
MFVMYKHLQTWDSKLRSSYFEAIAIPLDHAARAKLTFVCENRCTYVDACCMHGMLNCLQ